MRHPGLLNLLQQDSGYQSIVQGLNQKLQSQVVYGLVGSQKSFWVSGVLGQGSQPMVIIAPDEDVARKWADDLATFFPGQIGMFPVREMLQYQILAHSKELMAERLSIMAKIIKGEVMCLVTTGEALAQNFIPSQIFKESLFSLEKFQVVEWEQLIAKFNFLGYERVDLVEAKGQFAVRGGIIDIFLLTEDDPIRIEFFDDEIDSIRFFDLDDQRSHTELSKITISPARELILTEEAKERGQEAIRREWQATLKRLGKNGERSVIENLNHKVSEGLEMLEQGLWSEGLERWQPFFYPEQTTLLDYFPVRPFIVIDEYNRVIEHLEVKEKERSESFIDLLAAGGALPGQSKIYFSVNEVSRFLTAYQRVYLNTLPQKISGIEPKNIQSVVTKTMHPFMSKFSLLTEDLKLWKKDHYKIFLVVQDKERARYLQNLLNEHKVEATIISEVTAVPFSGIYITIGTFNQGFEYPGLKLVIITEQEVFGQRKRKKLRHKAKEGSKISVFTELEIGDYVVHVHHGVGRYLGIEKLTVDGIFKDYLLIQYAGEDKLYIPTDQIDLIQKYIGAEGHIPKLNKLGGSEWSKVKSRVKASVQDMAKDLLKLYAAREAAVGFAFSPDTVWQKEFEDAFPYTETPDQLQAILDVKKDMEIPKPMDRLLIGDVGYGKTEVALRAACKAVMDSKQVAVLVPTTVLAGQHYNTFRQRFKDYPVEIGLLSRFKSPKEQAVVLQGLKEGSIDIVIGTHRLLSADVKFKDLGLVIVDEEQRFGVAHKERLKQLRNAVDVLTLTATPIPRTLHMSLAGVRDMSVIETPPEDRYPVQTYVVEYSGELVRDAIKRELNRGGQVYFVHNRIADLERIAAHLQALVPQCKISIAHGQMKEDELEEAMLSFIEGESDVLVCTTIVENGLDISNVNTLIVSEADHLGLAQLYQLRGRVGRSNRLAYAYFTYRSDKVLNPLAEKRLRAIREFTEFGSGFKIAMRDLEIRGAGNLLGPEQHGHMLAVGFDLYCRLLEEAVEELKGEGESKEKEIQPNIEIEVDAYINDDYIANSGLKMEFYQRLAEAMEEDEIMEITDELVDRFGTPPRPVENLLHISKIRVLAKKLGAKSITAKKNMLKVEFPKCPLNGEQLFALDKEFKRRLNFDVSQGLRISVKLRPKEMEKTLVILETILKKIKILAGFLH